MLLWRPRRLASPTPMPWTEPRAYALLTGVAALALALPLLVGDAVFAGAGSDALSLVLPHYAFQANALRAGQLPLWNPYLLTGHPELAGAQWGVAYPPQLLLLPLVGAAAYIKLSLVLHALIGLWTARWLVRAWLAANGLPVSGLAVALAAPAMALSGFWSAHTHAGHIQFAQALPWLIGVAAAGLDACRGRPRAGVAIAGCLGLAILAGGPQLAPFGLAGAAALWAAALWHTRRWQALVAIAAGLCVGAALAAVQVLPALELTAESARARLPMATFAQGYQWQWTYLPSLLVPDWPRLVGARDPWEFDAWVGAPALALALVGVAVARSRRTVAPLWLAALALFALAGPLGATLQATLPGVDLLRVPARMALGSTWCVGLAAASAAAAFQPGLDWRPASVGALGLAVIALLIGPATPLAWVCAACSVGAAAALWPRPNGPRAPHLAVAAAMAALLTVSLAALDTAPSPLASPVVAAGARAAAMHPHDRVVSLAHRQWNTGMATGVRQLGAYEPFATWRTAVLQKALTLGTARGPWPKMFAIWPGRAARWSPLWDALAVRSAVADQPVAAGPNLRATDAVDGAATFATPAPWPRAFAVSCARPVPGPIEALDEVARAPGPAAWVEFSGDLPACPSAAVAPVTWLVDDAAEVTVRAALPWSGWLVLSDLPYPGWRATVNGRQAAIAPANGVGRAVQVPAGEVEVAFRYQPRAVAWGALVSALALAVASVWAWRGRSAPPVD